MGRREFVGTTAAATALAAFGEVKAEEAAPQKRSASGKPNLVFVFADEWRAQATGYAGDPNAITPNLDLLAENSLNFTHAVSGCPVCTPYRASLLTGQYWMTHGLFLNDVHLRDEAISIAEALGGAGYDTAYIGKWHLDGHGRSNFIPRERRQGFDFWKVLECTHEYNKSFYYADEDVKLNWEGYDAIAQTQEAQRYIREHKGDKPFTLFLSWGPPHDPYGTAPEKYRKMYDPAKIVLAENVPEKSADIARKELAGYYAHITALDDCVADLLRTLEETGIADNTLFVFTSDHGDMMHSQGAQKKQQPYEESIRVPFLLRYPEKLGEGGRTLDTAINTPDIMPTLLGLCGVEIPETVEGNDFSGDLIAGKTPQVDGALLMCPAPFGQWTRKVGGREYRGVRTKRHTYVRDLNGPWLLYDNERDPYQLENLVGKPEYADIQSELDAMLNRKLEETGDRFLTAEEHISQWGYKVDKNNTVPYSN
jgi:arylsulfatase A-like enzyme